VHLIDIDEAEANMSDNDDTAKKTWSNQQYLEQEDTQ
jgi:hypothetical protein